MKITNIVPLAYTPGKLEYFQFIRGGVGADCHQGPSFFQFDDGTVRLVWGAYDFNESSPNSVALYSDSPDRGITWTDPQVYMADFTAGQKGTLLLNLKNGGEVLMCVVQVIHRIEVDEVRRVTVKGPDYFSSRTKVFIRRSVDGGHYFDDGYIIPWQQFTDGLALKGEGMYYGDAYMLRLQSGRILLAGCYMDPNFADVDKQVHHYSGVCMLSDDSGHTWKRSQTITTDVPLGVMEMQIAETQPNRLFCLFRTTAGCLYQTASTDGGETWSKTEPSLLPSPVSLSRMIRLQSGNLLLVWNNVSSNTHHPRHPLSAALSKDGGNSWGMPKLIADEIAQNQLSNHGMIQLDDGRILLGISHHRDVRPGTSDLDMAIFDEQWLDS